MFSLICDRINYWVNNPEVGDWRRHRGHYDVTVIYQDFRRIPLYARNKMCLNFIFMKCNSCSWRSLSFYYHLWYKPCTQLGPKLGYPQLERRACARNCSHTNQIGVITHPFLNKGGVAKLFLTLASGWLIAFAWWRHQMEKNSALLAICAGNSPVSGEFPAQRPVTRSFDVLFDLRPNKRLSKQLWGWWFETHSPPLWRHSNGHASMFTIPYPCATLS